MESSSRSDMSRREFLRRAAAGAVVAAGMGSRAGWAADGMSAESDPGRPESQVAAQLPEGVKAVWDLGKAYHETTPTQARVCINGLWRWQPAAQVADQVPAGRWGYFKVPGCWPGIADYMQKDSQTVHMHPSWQDVALRDITAAWYQRTITIPSEWAGRRISLYAECLNSYAAVYIASNKVGEIRFPAGEVDLTSVCQPGGEYVLSMLVLAMPLKAVMLSYSDTASAKEVKGFVARRGLCGDVYLISTPMGARITDVRVDTSVRNWEIRVEAGLQGLVADVGYALRAEVMEGGRRVQEFTSTRFTVSDLKDGRFAFTRKWRPDKLWDLHTPENTYQLVLSLLDGEAMALDTAHPVRFGFREFWIEGRDFYLNGTRLFLSSVPLDNAGVGAMASTYEAARESLSRLKGIGITFVYGHNYGCEPGSHLSFAEILRAADDVGMLVALSQPHFGHYDWRDADADRSNGYAQHAQFYVQVAGSHPSVVAYSMSHNATGYNEDMNPDLIDGVNAPRGRWGERNSRLALRAEAIVAALDPVRIIYHHSSGNLSSMHTVNFYPNFVPAQELSDWLEHWASVGVKPFFTVEYAAPMTWDWTMYRGWYQGKRTFGSAVVPWEFCQAEWSAQFLGDRAYRIIEAEKTNLRWEAKQFREGKLWHRWDYPYHVGVKVFDDQHTIIGMYTTDNWRAYRTWEMSATSPWDYEFFWRLRDGVVRKRRQLPVDWENLQRPGLSPDYLEDQYERVDMAFELSDWEPTADAQALLRNNMPLLTYIAGKPARFTSKDHNFRAGETVEKQLVIINNCRETVNCDWEWSVNLLQPVAARGRVSVPTGNQERIPIRFDLPAALAPGSYELKAVVKFSNGEAQEDSFSIHVLRRPAALGESAKTALFDPKEETSKLLGGMGVRCQAVDASADLSPYQVLVIGKGALTVDGLGPDLSRVRQGLKVIVFEQTSEALERRLGFRVQEYGLRQVFPRLPGHPALAGLEVEHLCNWRGEATLLPPRLKYATDDEVFNGAPTVKWCDIPVTRVWRCGCRGNVASVLIEKPARGDFLPLLDGGFSLQYSPLMEYREGKGMILFCQMDVTGRSESDPAAETLTRNLLEYVAAWKPVPSREALYIGDPAGQRYFEVAGVPLGSYQGGGLSRDQVLIVGPGGGQQLAGRAELIASWLETGGHLLAIGLDEVGANAFLPFRVSMRREEHICAWFEAFGMGSLLAGVGPGEIMNRDPRELSLLSAGASVVGNGVLAKGEKANVVFCQVVPWEFEWQKQMNLKRTYRRASFLVDRLLANMGVAGSTPLLGRFGEPVTGTSTGKRWLEGLYLDQPEEWDDPYRFFRW